MAKNIVTYSTILKRSRCINSNNLSSSDMANAYKLLNSKLSNPREANGRISSTLESALSSFLTGICNIDNANAYYRQVMYFIQEFNSINTKISDYILSEYTNNILFYVYDLTGIQETITRYDLLDHQINNILEASSRLIVADRILKNHGIISNRFGIEDTIRNIICTTNDLKSMAEACCEAVDTFTIKSYQKLNLTIEECIYLFGKNGIDYNKEYLVKYALEYFLLRDNIDSERDIDGYRIALTESHCLIDNDLSLVRYLFDEYNDTGYNRTHIKIGKYLMSSNKTIDTMFDTIVDIIDHISELGLQNNIGKIIEFMFDVYKSNIFTEDDIKSRYSDMLNIIVDKVNKIIDSGNMRKEILDIIISNINAVKDSIIINRNNDYEYVSKVTYFKSILDDFIEELEHSLSILYPAANLDSMNTVNTESSEIIPIKEFKVFKFHNLVNAAINLDKYLKEKAQKGHNKVSNKVKNGIKKFKNILFNETDESIYSYIGEDHKADICVAQIYLNESDIPEAHKFLNEVCKEFNDKLLIENKDSIKAYYIINPGMAEVHVKESAIIELSEEDLNIIAKSESLELETYIDDFAMMESCCELYESFEDGEITNIKEKISEFANNSYFDMEHFEVALEALSLLNVSEDDIKVFGEQFGNYRYKAILESGGNGSYLSESKKIDSIVNNWVKESNVPIDIQLEAYQALCAVLEAGPDIKKPDLKKPDIKKDKDDSKDKEENKGVMDKFRNKAKDVKDNVTSKFNKKDDKDKDDDSKDKKEDGDNKKKKNPFSGVNLNNIKLYLEGLKSKMKNMSQKEKEMSRNLDNWFRRFSKSLHDAMISDRREAIIKGSVIPSFSKCIKIAIGLAGLGIVTGSPVAPILTAFAGFAVSKDLTKKERILMLDEIETELQVLEKEIAMAESKNQMKKYRALLTYKKDLQRQYQRIKYNVRVGKDILPNSTAGLRNND